MSRTARDGAGITAEVFEQRYRSDADPWAYETSGYERRKYAHTLQLAGPGPFSDALEMGCSIGVFTEMLAPRCERLVACDFSPTAVRAARSRTEKLPGVRVEQRDLARELPQGEFDLVVCSEVLYYWDPAAVQATIDRVLTALRPGGALVTVGWTGDDPQAPLDSTGVRELLLAAPALRLARSEPRPEYLIDRWEPAL